MNKVASHINEMQKIHEEYGSVFDQLITEQSSEKKEVGRGENSSLAWSSQLAVTTQLLFSFFLQVADLSMGDLLLHNTVTWINPPASLGKWKKEPQMATFGMPGLVV